MPNIKFEVTEQREPKLWSRKNADGKQAEIFLYDVIDGGFFGGISAKGFAKQLRDLGEVDQITLRINSPGGFVFEATAIHNLLKNHKAKKLVVVDGLAASAASFIMLVGDTITVPKNAYVMIHNSASIAFGGKKDMRKEADLLDKIDGTIAEMYADRGAKSVEEFAALMDEETWLTGDEAKALGLADQVTEKAQAKNEFDLSQFGYRNVPADLRAAVASSSVAQNTPFFNTIAAFAGRPSGDSTMATEATKPAETSAAIPPAPPAINAAPTQPAAPPAAPVDAAAIAKQATDAANKRASDIAAACQLCGKPERAAAFIADSAVTAESVTAQLFKEMCAANAAVGAPGAGAAGEVDSSNDENKKFKDEYKANPEFKKVGISEEDYVFSRRVDEGLETPALA